MNTSRGPGSAFGVGVVTLRLSTAGGARPALITLALVGQPAWIGRVPPAMTAGHCEQRASCTGDRPTMAVSLTPAGAHAVHQWLGTNAAILSTAVASLCPGWQHLLAAALSVLRELATAVDSLADQASQPQGADAT